MTDKAEEALKGADVAVFVGGFPRKQGMERKDLIGLNTKIFSEQGRALEKVASKKVKVLVVANPANTNCLILRQNAPSVPLENFTCLTRLDFNRAVFQVAKKTASPVEAVRNATIWGNHSATQVPDVTSASVLVNGVYLPARQAINDEAWVKGAFLTTVQQRGKAVIDARKLSSAMSAANAIGDHLRSWLVTGTAPGCTVPMGVVSQGWYGVQKGLVFSFPCVVDKPGTFRVAEGFTIDEFIAGKIKLTEKELLEERAEAEAALASAKL